MDQLFIADRVTFSDAADLMARFGDQAEREAKARAERSRTDGNVQRFCHWRQIERVISALASHEADGTIH